MQWPTLPKMLKLEMKIEILLNKNKNFHLLNKVFLKVISVITIKQLKAKTQK